MRYHLLFLLTCLAAGCCAQGTYRPRDTSFSIHSTYEKLRKDYPDVKEVYLKSPRRVVHEANVVYATIDGDRPLHLDVFHRRKQHGTRPGVLLIHGGGWTTGSKENLLPMAERLAGAGYVAVVVEYRLSAEAPYPAAVQDLKTAVRWMRTHAEDYGIDATQIAAFGCSAGAHLASLLGTTNGMSLYDAPDADVAQSADVQAVLNIDGIVSFIHPEAEPEWTGRSATQWLSSYPEHYDRWREASPLEYAGANTPPFLFVNSSYPRFHAGRDDLIEILDEVGTYSEVYTLAGSPHGFWLLDPWFEPTLTYTLKFLKQVF